jgi:hypothetical protein
MRTYEVRSRKDKRGVDLISDALPFGRLWYGGPNAIGNAIGYAQFYGRSHDAVIRVYDDAGNVIETHEQWRSLPPPFGTAALALALPVGPRQFGAVTSLLTALAQIVAAHLSASHA